MDSLSHTCVICLETIEHVTKLLDYPSNAKDQESRESLRPVALLVCGHRFHLDCISNSFVCTANIECPSCRCKQPGEWKVWKRHKSRRRAMNIVPPPAPLSDTLDEDATMDDMGAEPVPEDQEMEEESTNNHGYYYDMDQDSFGDEDDDDDSEDEFFYEDDSEDDEYYHFNRVHRRFSEFNPEGLGGGDDHAYYDDSSIPPIHYHWIFVLANEQLQNLEQQEYDRQDILRQANQESWNSVIRDRINCEFGELLEKMAQTKRIMQWALAHEHHHQMAPENEREEDSEHDMISILFTFLSDQIKLAEMTLQALQQSQGIYFLNRRELALSDKIGRLHAIERELKHVHGQDHANAITLAP